MGNESSINTMDNNSSINKMYNNSYVFIKYRNALIKIEISLQDYLDQLKKKFMNHYRFKNLFKFFFLMVKNFFIQIP